MTIGDPPSYWQAFALFPDVGLVKKSSVWWADALISLEEMPGRGASGSLTGAGVWESEATVTSVKQRQKQSKTPSTVSWRLTFPGTYCVHGIGDSP